MLEVLYCSFTRNSTVSWIVLFPLLASIDQYVLKKYAVNNAWTPSPRPYHYIRVFALSQHMLVSTHTIMAIMQRVFIQYLQL